MAGYEVGDKWGHLEITDIRVEDVVIEENGVTERYSECRVYMSCNCGNKFYKPQAEMPGKRQLQDCGCGCGKRSSVRPDMFSVGLDPKTADHLYRFCRVNGVDLSGGLKYLIRRGLAEHGNGIPVIPEDMKVGRMERGIRRVR